MRARRQRPARRPSDVAEVFTTGESEGRGFDGLDGGEDTGDLLVESADGAQHEELCGGFGEHDPFAATGVDEGAGLEGGGGAEYRKNNPSICGAGKAADTGIVDIAAGRFRMFDTADTLEDHLSVLSAEAFAGLSSNADTEQ